MSVASRSSRPSAHRHRAQLALHGRCKLPPTRTELHFRRAVHQMGRLSRRSVIVEDIAADDEELFARWRTNNEAIHPLGPRGHRIRMCGRLVRGLAGPDLGDADAPNSAGSNHGQHVGRIAALQLGNLVELGNEVVAPSLHSGQSSVLRPKRRHAAHRSLTTGDPGAPDVPSSTVRFGWRGLRARLDETDGGEFTLRKFIAGARTPGPILVGLGASPALANPGTRGRCRSPSTSARI